MPALPLLKNPESYVACTQDLHADANDRAYWLDLFEQHLDSLATLPIGGRQFQDLDGYRAFADDYLNGLADLRAAPQSWNELTVLALTQYRDRLLRQCGFDDPFQDLKQRENERALAELPAVLHAIDDTEFDALPELLARGLFAGNLFDMGSHAAIAAFERAGDGFAAACDRVKARPWPFDGLDEWCDRLLTGKYDNCLFFVDNAGPDILLGVLPFCRWLLASDVEVVLAANGTPSLNDITVDELHALLERVASIDPALRDHLRAGRLRVVDSGCAAPLIDLRHLTDACCAAARDANLLILEGMGRAVESNFHTAFTVDCLKIALVKDEMVARSIGVELFDPIFRFDAVD